jgi:UDPglucose 6-dehydrogenase
VNACDFALVAVPTPEGPDGQCDTSIVDAVVAWLESPSIVVLSTIAVGTTERLVRQTGKAIVHQPAYGPGETVGHPFGDLRSQSWIILGGERRHTIPTADLYKSALSADVTIWQTDARTAELTKYMENAFLALKVAFCNEMYDIAGAVGVDYNELRELWLLDPRIGRSHTLVYPDDRGFGGSCLPKDARALVHIANAAGIEAPLLASMISANERLRGQH